jgi:hypothetical protein
MTLASSLSRIIVRDPTFVLCSRPWESQACRVHLLIPPNRRAASSIESKLSKVRVSFQFDKPDFIAASRETYASF